MAKRTVHMAVSGAESPWREVGKVISRAVSSDDYEFDLQSHPDLANARAGQSEPTADFRFKHHALGCFLDHLAHETFAVRADQNVGPREVR